MLLTIEDIEEKLFTLSCNPLTLDLAKDNSLNVSRNIDYQFLQPVGQSRVAAQ